MANVYNLYMVEEGHIAVCKSLKERDDWHLGIGGNGAEPAWGAGDTPPIPDFASTVMLDEYGRRQVSQIDYVVADPAGDIGWDDSTWSISVAETRHLYLRFSFNPTEAVGLTVRQFGIFLGTVADPAVPLGQYYLEPADVSDPGKLFFLQNVTPRDFSAYQKETFHFVLTF